MTESAALVVRLRYGARSTNVAPRYYAGSRVVWEADVRNNQTQELAAASGLSVTWVSPTGAEITEAMTTVSAGVYRTPDLTVSDPGDWFLRVSGSGVAADERRFTVLAGALDPDAEEAVVLVTEDGEVILLDDGSGVEA